MISTTDYGLLYTDADKQNLIETKRLWALGNFSRFIRPGAVRVETAVSSASGLRDVAFHADEPMRVILVVVNSASMPVSASLEIEGMKLPQTVAAYATSRRRNLTQAFVQLKSNQYDFPERSVTSLVIG